MPDQNIHTHAHTWCNGVQKQFWIIQLQKICTCTPIYTYLKCIYIYSMYVFYTMYACMHVCVLQTSADAACTCSNVSSPARLAAIDQLSNLSIRKKVNKTSSTVQPIWKFGWGQDIGNATFQLWHFVGKSPCVCVGIYIACVCVLSHCLLGNLSLLAIMERKAATCTWPGTNFRLSSGQSESSSW